MTSRRRQVRIAFALVVLLALAALFVHGPASGMAALAAMVMFIVACALALRGGDRETVARSNRTGLSGWFWF